jgi:hypothetical protein
VATEHPQQQQVQRVVVVDQTQEAVAEEWVLLLPILVQVDQV